jgi:hypothetical protein
MLWRYDINIATYNLTQYEETMQKYNVNFDFDIKSVSHLFNDKAAYTAAMQDALQKSVSKLEEFATKHPGKITIGEISESDVRNQTVSIEAEPAVAEELRKKEGISSVYRAGIFHFE